MREASFELFASGSMATSAGTAHLATGNYTGLSTLNNDDVVYPWLRARTNSVRAYAKLADFGVRAGVGISTSVSGYTELKPMRAGAASLIHVANEVVGSNANVDWAFWRRI